MFTVSVLYFEHLSITPFLFLPYLSRVHKDLGPFQYLLQWKTFHWYDLNWFFTASNSNKVFLEKRGSEPCRRKDHNWWQPVLRATDTILFAVAALINSFSLLFFSVFCFPYCKTGVRTKGQHEAFPGFYGLPIYLLTLWGFLLLFVWLVWFLSLLQIVQKE